VELMKGHVQHAVRIAPWVGLRALRRGGTLPPVCSSRFEESALCDSSGCHTEQVRLMSMNVDRIAHQTTAARKGSPSGHGFRSRFRQQIRALSQGQST
jgi:hypothetical protein